MLPMRLPTIALLLAALAACSSHYTPRAGRRLSLVMRNGDMTYVRDGQSWRAGVFGGGLVKAVKGVPAAERAARTYHDRMTNGFLGYILGAVCTIGTVSYLAAEASDHRYDGAEEPSPVLIGASVGCAVLMFGSLGYALSGAPYQWDAINLYNDAIELAPPPALPARPAGLRPPPTP